MRRVVVTGLANITPIGSDWAEVKQRLRDQQTGIRFMQSWDQFAELNTRLAGPVLDFERPEHYSRKQIRSMGRVALMATRASELALENAGLLNDPEIKNGRMGVSYGSSSGDTDAIKDFGRMLLHKESGALNANTYLKMMGHTAPVNIGVFFGLTGRVVPTSTACTSGSQGIGYAFEAIKFGLQDVMLAGGAEGLCATQAAVFDTLYATSTRNSSPELTPRPFDKDRDGLVIGEGAGSLVLEERERALARGAKIHAEIVGFGTNSDGKHVTQPESATMLQAMQLAMNEAQLSPADIGYVSAHGTATDRGDVAETKATNAVLGAKVPISAMKSYTGHTLGACGAIEAITAINMMNDDWFHGTANLDNLAEELADLDYLSGTGRALSVSHVMSNNFAFGGINTSLIFARVE